MSVPEDSVMVHTTRGVGGERWWGEEGGGEGRGVAAHVCPRGLSHGTYN